MKSQQVLRVFYYKCCASGPLKVTKEVVYATKKMQAMIVNSGNANACTGKQGVKDAQTMQALV